MIVSQDLVQQIILVGVFLGAILTILKHVANLFSILKPFLGPVFFVGSILVPHGFIIWCWMYIAAINSNRIREGQVFTSLIIQVSLLTSLYTFIWGKWFYPKLNLWLQKQLTQTHLPNVQLEHKQKKEETQSSDISK